MMKMESYNEKSKYEKSVDKGHNQADRLFYNLLSQKDMNSPEFNKLLDIIENYPRRNKSFYYKFTFNLLQFLKLKIMADEENVKLLMEWKELLDNVEKEKLSNKKGEPTENI